LDAGKDFSEYCIQYNTFWNTTEGIEDCLYISTFTPKHPKEFTTKKELLPVMVYIHSGGFMFGRGAQFRPDYLMETKKVVAVVFQYRLGSFGTISLHINFCDLLHERTLQDF
jgi:carboxylesterase type B